MSFIRIFHLIRDFLTSLPIFNAPFEVSPECRAVFYALFERTAIPGIRLGLDAEAPPVHLGDSKFGGLPDLPQGMAWPREAGIPLAFIMQLNLAQLAEYDRLHELPPTGMLYIFYDLEECEMVRVLWSAADSPLAPAAYPEALDAAYRLPERAVSFSAVSMPPCELPDELMQECADFFPRDEEGFEPYETWCELRAQYVGYPHSDSAACMLLGRPDTIQGELESADARLLLQLASFEDAKGRFVLGDWGNAFLLIEQTDLEARDFSRVQAEMQCY